MMDYSLHMLARSEHDLRVRSLPTVHDFDVPFQPERSRWSRLSAMLRAIAGHVLTSPPNPPRRSRPSFTVSNPSPQLREDAN